MLKKSIKKITDEMYFFEFNKSINPKKIPAYIKKSNEIIAQLARGDRLAKMEPSGKRQWSDWKIFRPSKQERRYFIYEEEELGISALIMFWKDFYKKQLAFREECNIDIISTESDALNDSRYYTEVMREAGKI